MTDAPEPAIARLAALAGEAVAALRASAACTEVLADLEPERRVLGITRAARMAPRGRVWRLGVLLLDDGGGVLAAGRVVRAERPARRSVPAKAVAEQRSLRAAAVKGGIPEGETVNFDASPIDLDELARAGASGPLVLGSDGEAGPEVFVRWNPSQPDALTALGRYLADRVDLLVHRPTDAG